MLVRGAFGCGRPTTCVPLTVRDAIRAIERAGWFRVPARGGHRQYRHPSKEGRVTVPGRLSDDLHPKTAKSILRQAGLSR